MVLLFFNRYSFQFWTVDGCRDEAGFQPLPSSPLPSLSSLPHRIALTFVFRTSPSEASFCPVHREHFLQVLHGETFGTVRFLKINVICGGRGFLLRAVLVINWKLQNKHYVLVFVRVACSVSFAGALCLCGTVRDVSPLPSPEPPSNVM